MSIFRALSNTIVSTLNTVTDVADTANKTVGIATTYVDHRAKKQQLVDKQQVMLATAKDLKDVQDELKEDEDLADLYKQLEEEFA